MTLWAIVGVLTGAASVALHGYASYSVALALLGTLRRRRPPAPVADDDLPRILTVIPAHDEAGVIGALVQSLLDQRYPENRLTVVVVADRCRDGTAEIAARAGARVVERSGGPSGKTPAVLHALDAADAWGPFDALAVFDADNVVASGFLRALGSRIALGEDIVQGRIDPKNPTTSWVTASSALGFYAISELVQAPRERMGLSTPLMGTGWLGRMDRCRPLVERLSSLTDDLELSALSAEHGLRVAYESTAVLLDEKPLMLSTAARQRHRWMQGRWVVASEHVPRLLRRAATSGTLRERFRVLDVALQLVAPSLLFTAVSLALVASVELGLHAATAGAFVPLVAPPRATWIAATAYYLFPIPFILRLSPPMRIFWVYLVQPAYLVLSIPVAISGFLARRAQRWVRTERHGH